VRIAEARMSEARIFQSEDMSKASFNRREIVLPTHAHAVRQANQSLLPTAFSMSSKNVQSPKKSSDEFVCRIERKK
jgi:hypothetical protein